MTNQFAIPVSQLDADTRGAFIIRTYVHLLGAIFAFAGLEAFFFTSGIAYSILELISGMSWMIILGAFIVVGWLASHTAHRAVSPAMQYLALAGYVVAYAIIFVPLLAAAQYYAEGGVIESAALVTLIGFGALTAIAFYTRKDFSFLKGVLTWGMICALILIVAGIIFGFELGLYFSIGMVALAGGAVLYDTSNIIHRYPPDRHVAAALELFGSIALMFWYVLRIFMSRR